MTVFLVCILLVAFLSSATPALLGKYLGTPGTLIVVVGNSFLLYTMSIILLIHYLTTGQDTYVFAFDWISVDRVSIQFSFVIDSLGVVFFFLIVFISMIAQIYSYEYMYTDPHLPRYYSYLGLFTFFMISLVFSSNLVQLFFAWEGVGVCSYLLINFWYTRYQASKASILAILVNKVGDLAFLLAISSFYSLFYSTDVIFIKNSTLYITSLLHNKYQSYIAEHVLNTISNSFLMIYRISTLNLSIFIDYLEISCFVLFIACISKSAQFIFHIWLPEAMEGPTPVSSLLHAATMVTLGIFIILRMSNIFAQVPSLSLYMMLIGASTIFVASVINVLQTDLKKVVAYSTCSQLGYMFIGCGIGDYIDTIYQLFLHAFFKSMLFLSAGYLIYVCSSEQDIRKIGGLLKLVPLIYVIFFCGTISSIGYFSYGNAYSKEVLLELLGSTWHNLDATTISTFLFYAEFIPNVCVVLTSYYSIALLTNIFFHQYRGTRNQLNYMEYPTILLSGPLIILSIFSISAGYFYSELLSGETTGFFTDTLYTSEESSLYKQLRVSQSSSCIAITCLLDDVVLYSTRSHVFDITSFEFFDAITETVLLSTILLGFVLIIFSSYLFSTYELIEFSQNIYVDSYIYSKLLVINRIIVSLVLNKIFTTCYEVGYKFFDKGLLEFVGGYQLYKLVLLFLNKVHTLETGYFYHYIGFTILLFSLTVTLYIV